jgi:DNA-binding CsgD family transcriptional regulator
MIEAAGMQPMKKTGSRHTVIPKPKGGAVVAEVGLILLDPTLNIVAFDRGAAAILNYSQQPGPRPGTASAIPDEILAFIRARKGADRTAKGQFRIGKNEYHCRTYLMESYDGMSNPMIALHLERDSSANDAICEIVDKYHLTDREQEVLRGISLGLATKELADQMEISPNTVKAFLRLVMIKMGVRTRAGIIAKILHNGSALDVDEPEDPADPIGFVNRRAV